MLTQKKSSQQATRALPGFVSILTVLSLGIALLIMMLIMYQDTLKSQDAQKNNLLRNDYQQREDAFLRALTNIVPNKAMEGMMAGASSNTSDLNWTQIFKDALAQSNAQTAVDSTTKSTLGLSSMRAINTADTQQDLTTIINTAFKASASDAIISATNVSSSAPYPVITHANPGVTNTDYAITTAPTLNFTYQTGDTFIAKHNWWEFDVSFAAQDETSTNLTRVKKKYRISLYEIPAQLAINSAAFTNIGKHSDNSDWNSSKIKISGGTFAEGAKTSGTFSTGAIASRKGIELSDASNPMAVDNSARNDNLYEGGATTLYSSSSDAGLVAFTPINLGSNFYIRNLAIDKEPSENFIETTATTTNSTSWDFYSRGANQCVMTVTRKNPAGGLEANYHLYYKKAGVDDLTSFELIVGTSTTGISLEGDAIDVDMTQLIAFLGTDISANNSLFVDLDDDVDVKYTRLANADDLSSFTTGFSLVTNETLIIDGDVNTTDIPLSMFAQKTRYGSRYYKDLAIDFEGQLGSTAKNTKDTAVDIVDLKITGNDTELGGDDSADYTNVTATLKGITDIDKLPPINMMNWMVVIQEVH